MLFNHSLINSLIDMGDNLLIWFFECSINIPFDLIASLLILLRYIMAVSRSKDFILMLCFLPLVISFVAQFNMIITFLLFSARWCIFIFVSMSTFRSGLYRQTNIGAAEPIGKLFLGCVNRRPVVK